MKPTLRNRMLVLLMPLAMVAGMAQAGDTMDDAKMMDDGMASHDSMAESGHNEMADDTMMSNDMADTMDHGMKSDTMKGDTMDGGMMNEPMMEDQGMSGSDTMN